MPSGAVAVWSWFGALTDAQKVMLLLAICGLIGAIFGAIAALLVTRRHSDTDVDGNTSKLRLEGSLRRQQHVLREKVAFISNMSSLAADWSTTASKVSFYIMRSDPDRVQNALADFDNNRWWIMSSIRKEITRARRLMSAEQYQRMLIFYEQMETLDAKLMALASAETFEGHAVRSMHRLVHNRFPAKADNLLASIASEFGLLSEAATRDFKEEDLLFTDDELSSLAAVWSPRKNLFGGYIDRDRPRE